MKPQSERSCLVLNRQRKHAIDTRRVLRFVSTLASELEIGNRPFSVVFTTDKEMRRYNMNYRGFDKSTDVLSFRGDNGYLGDVLISSETAYNQALKSRTL